jgi:hypothetical protein
MTLPDLRLRVRGEYAEMPGLRLTVAQASRLWNIDRHAGESVLNALVAERFLFRTSDGAYMMWPAPRAAKVEHRRLTYGESTGSARHRSR